MEKLNQFANFGAGCFWCVEAMFLALKGVISVKPGYMGGKITNPTYKEVCSGLTGHAEIIRIEFDSSIISFSELLEAFFQAHDPTQLNRQGNDVGTQYRSAIFYEDEIQHQLSKTALKAANESGQWNVPIVTEVSEVSTFYEAEDYHHNYFAQNPNQAYCSAVVRPKVDKFLKKFRDRINT